MTTAASGIPTWSGTIARIGHSSTESCCRSFVRKPRNCWGNHNTIFAGTDLDYTEAPHLYKYDGFYYLVTAEGGTGFGHAVTMARSRSIEGPYVADPSGPLVTARDDPDWPLQRAGHGDLVETENGEFFFVHLCGRPLDNTRRCPLGRETAIQRLEKTPDGWFRLQGRRSPAGPGG